MLWKVLKENDNYEISENGDVRSKLTNKILKRRNNKKSHYQQYVLQDVYYYIHRLVANNFLPAPTLEQLEWAKQSHYGVVQVNHIDGNKRNNHFSNLEWSTGKDNIQHAFDNKLNVTKSGYESHLAILSKSDVEYIINNSIPGSREHGLKAMAKKFNVHYNTVLYYMKRYRSNKL